MREEGKGGKAISLRERKKKVAGGCANNANQAIVCRGVENFGFNCWTEVSGVMEHYFERHGGRPIPNIYAPSLLKKTNLTLDGDGYHYLMQTDLPDVNCDVKTGQDKRCIFGFQSEESYSDAVKNFEEYALFHDYAVSGDDATGKSRSGRYMFLENGMPRIVDDAVGYIGYIGEMVYENDTHLVSMTPCMYSMLQKAVGVLTDIVNSIPSKFKGRIQDNIETGKDLLSETYPVQIRQFNPARGSTAMF